MVGGPDGGGDSDHACITTLISLKTPQFVPRRQHHRTAWDAFKAAMRSPTTSDYGTPHGTLAAADDIPHRFQAAIEKSNPRSKPGHQSNACRTPEIDQRKMKLAGT